MAGGTLTILNGVMTMLFSPTEQSGVAEFYAIWMTIFVGINVIWDFLTPRTEPFHLVHMSEKIETVFSATTFTSSLYLVLTIFQQEVTTVTGSGKIPLVISAFSGTLISLKYLCPYEIPIRKKSVMDMVINNADEPKITAL